MDLRRAADRGYPAVFHFPVEFPMAGKKEVHIPAFLTYSCVLCGACCRRFDITFVPEEYRRLAAYSWDRFFPELKGQQLFEPIVKNGLAMYRLPHRPEDGGCVFLKDNKCLMHRKIGFEKKLYACQCYPYTFAYTPSGIYTGLRFECPGIGSEGAPSVMKDRPTIERLAHRLPAESSIPDYGPRMLLHRKTTRSWEELLELESIFMGLFVRSDHSLKRRMLSAGLLVEHLARANVGKLSPQEFIDVCHVMGEACLQNAPGFSPSASAAKAGTSLARQLLSDLLVQASPVYYELSLWKRIKFRLSAFFERATFAAGKGTIRAETIGAVNARSAEVSRLEPCPEAEKLINTYLTGKLFGKNFYGPLFHNYPFLEGMALLLAVVSCLITLARAAAIERGEHAELSADDVKKAMQAVDIRYGALKTFKTGAALTRASLLTRESVVSGLLHSVFAW